jgi:hypothetical protein
MAKFRVGRFGGDKRLHEARQRALSRGDALALPCQLRRTSSRGWGPWTDADLDLGALPDGDARWRVADPVTVGYPILRGPVDQPFEEVTDVLLRAVRFPSEAFYGMAAEIVVVVADHSTMEIALPAGQGGPTASRLQELLLDRSDSDGR